MRCRGHLETSTWRSEFRSWRRKQDLWAMRRRGHLETEKNIEIGVWLLESKQGLQERPRDADERRL